MTQWKMEISKIAVHGVMLSAVDTNLMLGKKRDPNLAPISFTVDVPRVIRIRCEMDLSKSLQI